MNMTWPCRRAKLCFEAVLSREVGFFAPCHLGKLAFLTPLQIVSAISIKNCGKLRWIKVEIVRAKERASIIISNPILPKPTRYATGNGSVGAIALRSKTA